MEKYRFFYKSNFCLLIFIGAANFTVFLYVSV